MQALRLPWTARRHALPKPDDTATALVQVLALNLVFVGQRDASGWLLAPVIDDPSVDLKVGTGRAGRQCLRAARADCRATER